VIVGGAARLVLCGLMLRAMLKLMLRRMLKQSSNVGVEQLRNKGDSRRNVHS
jgi:hypothetical protein